MNEQNAGRRLNQYQHCRLRPDMYLGKISTTTHEIWSMNAEFKASFKHIIFNNGLFNIVREGLSNSIDNVWRSKQLAPETPVKYISLEIDTNSGRITIINDGYCIPVRKADYEYKDPRTGVETKESLYPAEVFFGEFNTGTNYDDESTRKTSGRNGVGAKLTVAFSKEFTINHTNPEDKMMFTQHYSNGGETRSLPEISPYTKKKGYTSISFIPDYKYFKYPTVEEHGIDENFINVIRMYVHEVAMISGVVVKFVVDGEITQIKVPNLEKFARLYYPSAANNKMILFTAPTGDECVLIENDLNGMDEMDSINQISYVNGVRTKDGGTHVKAWGDAVIGKIVKLFNKRKVKPGMPLSKASARQVYPYLTLFVRSEVDRPVFDSQAKDELMEVRDDSNKPGPYRLYDPRSKVHDKMWKEQSSENFKKIMKWGFVGFLEEKINAKALNQLSKKDISSVKVPLGDNGRHANWAYGPRKGEAMFLITEGLSPMSFVERGIDSVEGGHDKYGVFAIRGKFINVYKNPRAKVLSNEEPKKIRSALNLVDGLDYSIQENFETLNYGSVGLVPDQDSDGLHIRALLIGFFSQFKGLLDRGFVSSISTAIMAIVWNEFKKNEKKQLFFSVKDFRDYVAKNGLKGGQVKYYKGLGSLKPQDAPLYFNPPKFVVYKNDEKAQYSMLLGIGSSKENRAQRKEYITRDIEESFVEQPDRKVVKRDVGDFVYEGELTITNFFEDQLVIFHNVAVERAIPCIWDGLKDGQRKIIYTLMLPQHSKVMDLERVTGVVKTKTNYEHGGVSVQHAAVKMAQRYVGSNNIPLLVDDGEAGTRKHNGANHAAGRYFHTKLEDITRAIYPPEDLPILTQKVEAGETVEYKYFVSVIPMALINGATGVGSGVSTEIPCYNPMEIVKRIEWMLDGKNLDDYPEKLIPWYMGYQGKITMKDDTTWTSQGTLEPSKKKGYWEVSELAIGVSTQSFIDWLEYLQHGKIPEGKKWKKIEKTVLNDVKDDSLANTVSFQIKAIKDFQPSVEGKGNLGAYIKSNHSLKNMILIDGNNFYHKFASPEAIIKAHYGKKIATCGLRKDYYLQEYTKNLPLFENKLRFLKCLRDKTLDIKAYESRAELDKKLEEMGFQKFLPKNKKKKEDDEDEIEEETKKKDEPKPSYSYLLSQKVEDLMLVSQFETLEKKIAGIIAQRDELQAQTLEDIWRQDLARFKKSYSYFMKHRSNVNEVKTTQRKPKKGGK